MSGRPPDGGNDLRLPELRAGEKRLDNITIPEHFFPFSPDYPSEFPESVYNIRKEPTGSMDTGTQLQTVYGRVGSNHGFRLPENVHAMAGSDPVRRSGFRNALDRGWKRDL